MKCTIFKLAEMRIMYNFICKVYRYNTFKRYYSDEVKYTLRKDAQLHPYRKVHPWNSLDSFSKYLLNNIVYNRDGLVALNKPFGISARRNSIKTENSEQYYTRVLNEVDYTVSDALPYIAQKLGYSELSVIKTPEKFTSGLLLLAADKNVENAIDKSYKRTVSVKILNKVYWIVTTNIPKVLTGKEHLCMRRNLSPDGKTYIEMSSKWSKQEQKRRDVKVLHVEFKVISNSMNNLSSLIEIKSSTSKWHAVRLFAATILYSPILGDNIYGRRVHEVAGTYVLSNPLLELKSLPKLNPQLLEILYLTKAKQELIPVHIHLRRIHLPSFLPKQQELILEAPLLPPFEWTCRQLKFKHIPEFEENRED